ncbi:hypothetical protein [Xylanimonas oleitrophica]|uniref:hypothetical protein n=1 Tax=Xylanimonas oleitrophica TaxID=2607479 RepID=UPI0015CFE060|nr:hypothetical protein [Xylanimonas oleitrophica]
MIARQAGTATRRAHPGTPGAAALVVLLVGVLAVGCTPAPSGRLDTRSGADLPTTAPEPETSAAPMPDYDPATAVGDYAEGFPTDLLAAPEGATVVASSARPQENGTTQVSLNLSTPATVEDVLAQVGAPLAVAGFTETAPSVITGLSAQTAWTRRTEREEGPLVETLLVGVLDEDDRRLVSISGTVAAPAG